MKINISPFAENNDVTGIITANLLHEFLDAEDGVVVRYDQPVVALVLGLGVKVLQNPVGFLAVALKNRRECEARN